MKHVVMYSGGLASWGAAKRCIERYGVDNVQLMFADTMMEDDDLHRFMKETVAEMGVQLVILADGRTPWEVFKDVRFLGNTRVDPCSRALKREPIRKWIEDSYEPHEVTIHMGMDWSEAHRLERARPYWEPYIIDAPLLWDLVGKPQLMKELAALDIELPRLYKLGFQHNNCGGFCIKAGQANFKLLLESMPERYAEHEQEEEKLRAYLDADVAILRDRTGGDTKPMTMKDFRLRLGGKNQLQPLLFDELDWGTCDCFTGVPETTESS